MPRLHSFPVGPSPTAFLCLLASFAALCCPSGSMAASEGTAGIMTVMTQSTVATDASGRQVLLATQRPAPGTVVRLMLSARAPRDTRRAVFVMPVPPAVRFTGHVTAPRNAAVSYSTDGLTYSAAPVKLASGRALKEPVSAYTSVRFELPELPGKSVVSFSIEGVAR